MIFSNQGAAVKALNAWNIINWYVDVNESHISLSCMPRNQKVTAAGECARVCQSATAGHYSFRSSPRFQKLMYIYYMILCCLLASDALLCALLKNSPSRHPRNFY